MQVKGTGLVTTRDFVKDKYPSKYDAWLQSLPEDSAKYFKGMLMKAGWFPLKEAYLIPMEHIVQMFYSGDQAKGGDALGHYSAEIALTGIYKAFLLIASPSYLMKRASSMMSTFYNPSKIEVKETGTKQIVLSIQNIENISKTLEYRIGGWCKRALELSSCKDVKYAISHVSHNGVKSSEIQFTWA